MSDYSIIITIITTIITLTLSLLVKKWFEKKFYIFKLESDHKYVERKRVKEAISKNKVHLINACEILNHRFYNFKINHMLKWHFVDGAYDKSSKYYFNSFVWRIAYFYAWIDKVENDLIYMDTTIATQNDLYLVKFMRLFKQVLCDTLLVETDNNYDTSKETDHFFAGTMTSIATAVTKSNNILTFDEYTKDLKSLSEKLKPLCKFIDSVSPDEDRHRWDRLILLHLSLLCFLNVFGYDFQQTELKKLNNALPLPINNDLLSKYEDLLKRNKLHKNKKVKRIIKFIKKHP